MTIKTKVAGDAALAKRAHWGKQITEWEPHELPFTQLRRSFLYVGQSLCLKFTQISQRCNEGHLRCEPQLNRQEEHAGPEFLNQSPLNVASHDA